MTANLCLTCMVLILYTLLHKSPTATCTSGIVPESSHTSSVSDTTQQEQATAEGEFTDLVCKKLSFQHDCKP